MIGSLIIDNLRGIRHGELRDLRPLTIVSGKNGCGKSTVLDALLLAAGTASPIEALITSVLRHPAAVHGARWLVGPAADLATITLTCMGDLETVYECKVSGKARHAPDEPPPGQTGTQHWDLRSDRVQRVSGNAGGIDFSEERVLGGGEIVRFAANNSYKVVQGGVRHRSVFGEVRLLDPAHPLPLSASYSEIARLGRKPEVLALLKHVIPDAEDIEILTEDDGTPALYLVKEAQRIPVSMSGQGVQSFLQLALEVTARDQGLMLLEQPGVYHHPRTIWHVARTLLAAVKRGVQIVATMPDLALLDSLLVQAESADLEQMALFTLGLDQGTLHTNRLAGQNLASSRRAAQGDLG